MIEGLAFYGIESTWFRAAALLNLWNTPLSFAGVARESFNNMSVFFSEKSEFLDARIHAQEEKSPTG